MLRKRKQLEPLLQFHGLGGYTPEYLPTDEFKVTKWFYDKYLSLRGLLGLDIYYWHTRHIYSPAQCKTQDLMFIMHVLTEHDAEPTDPSERRQFKRAMNRYGREISYVLGELAKGRAADTASGDIYAYAYRDKWLRFPQDRANKTLYHGIKFHELSDVFEESSRLIGQYLDEYDERLEAATKKLGKKSPAQGEKSDR